MLQCSIRRILYLRAIPCPLSPDKDCFSYCQHWDIYQMRYATGYEHEPNNSIKIWSWSVVSPRLACLFSSTDDDDAFGCSGPNFLLTCVYWNLKSLFYNFRSFLGQFLFLYEYTATQNPDRDTLAFGYSSCGTFLSCGDQSLVEIYFTVYIYMHGLRFCIVSRNLHNPTDIIEIWLRSDFVLVVHF